METSHKSPASKQTCTNRTLQDGVNSVSERSHTERGLDGKTRPEGCLPSCSRSPCSPKPLQLQLKGQTLEVQNFTLWSQQCSSNLHQAHEASHSFDEEASHPGHSIPGEYAHHGPEGGGDQGVPSNSIGNSDCSRFCNQPSQECDYSHTRDGVLRLPTGFKGNGHLTSTEENEILEAGSLTAEKSETGFGASLGQTVRHDGSCPPCSLASPLYYRYLERTRSLALQMGLTYKSIIEVDQEMEPDLDWWIHQAQLHNARPLQILHWDLTIETDASKVGWGACCNQIKTGGPWTLEEKQKHINFLELLAVFLAIKSFVSDRRQINILLRIDNITAIAFLNWMGGSHSLPLSELAIAIWQWCLEQEITLHTEHLPGSENVRADWESRHVQDSSNWMLHKGVFQQLHNQLGPFTIDLFASRTNAQLPVYCSWRPDPAAFTVDALSLSWKGHLPYLFPPFALITRCIQKIQEEESNTVLIAPVWHNQLWYPLILECLSDYPILLPPIPKILTGPVGEDHPMVLEGHLPLATWPISGIPLLQKGFQRGLSTSSAAHGGPQLRHPIHQPGGLGIAGALDGVSIPFLLL